MKKGKRFFVNLRVSCVGPVLVALCVWGCEKAVVDETPPVRPVRFFQVGASTGRELRTYPGIVEASQEVDLAFRVSGPLVELNATEGNRVEKGATLAQIDPRDYENRLAQTTSSLESAEAELKAMGGPGRGPSEMEAETPPPRPAVACYPGGSGLQSRGAVAGGERSSPAHIRYSAHESGSGQSRPATSPGGTGERPVGRPPRRHRSDRG